MQGSGFGGHVGFGFGFFLIGLWHLFNNVRLQCISPSSYIFSPWFPTSVHRYLELFLIMGGSTVCIATELFIGHQRYQPFDPDWTIPAERLPNLEHSIISSTFFAYAALAILLDSLKLRATYQLSHLLAALAFSQQFLLFHFHTGDHTGVEGQYHLLLQPLILVSLLTTLMGIRHPRSFLFGFVRSMSVLFLGLWLMVIGVVLWTPGLVPKGCRMNLESGRLIVRCRGEAHLHRAKSLVNLQFSWLMLCIAIFSLLFYIFMIRRYGERVDYMPLQAKYDAGAGAGADDDSDGAKFQSQKIKQVHPLRSVEMGLVTAP